MKKFWRGFRKESDLHERQEVAKVKSDLIEKLRELIRTGGHEGEDEFVRVLKQINPQIRGEELREKIKQYHDAVSERQLLDRGSL